MKATGGCLCGQIRYEVNSDTFIEVRCHCRDCQYVSGGEVIKFLRVRIPAPVNRPEDNCLDYEPRGDCDIRQLPHRSLADLAVQVLSECGHQTASRALEPKAGKL